MLAVNVLIALLLIWALPVTGGQVNGGNKRDYDNT